MHNIFKNKAETRYWNLSCSKGYEHMLNAVSTMRDKQVVIDTGATLLGALNEHAGVIDAFGGSGYGVRIVFVGAHNADSSAAFRRYICAYKERRNVRTVIVLNAIIPTISDPEDFDLVGHEDISAIIEKRRIPVLYHPYMDPEYARWLMDGGRLPSVVLADRNLPFGSRLMYKEWFSQKSDPVIRAILAGGGDHGSSAVS